MKRVFIVFLFFLLSPAVFMGRADAFVWTEQSEAGAFPATADIPVGPGELERIDGVISIPTSDDADMYRIHIFDTVGFRATTVGGAGFDTQLFLFDASGHGVTFNDDTSPTLQSTLTGTFVSTAGTYYLGISSFDRDATSGGAEIWDDDPLTVERAPDGPGAGGAIDGWNGNGIQSGAYSIFLHGVDASPPVPEPSTVALLGLGLGGAALTIRRRRSR